MLSGQLVCWLVCCPRKWVALSEAKHYYENDPVYGSAVTYLKTQRFWTENLYTFSSNIIRTPWGMFGWMRFNHFFTVTETCRMTMSKIHWICFDRFFLLHVLCRPVQKGTFDWQCDLQTQKSVHWWLFIHLGWPLLTESTEMVVNSKSDLNPNLGIVLPSKNYTYFKKIK